MNVLPRDDGTANDGVGRPVAHHTPHTGRPGGGRRSANRPRSATDTPSPPGDCTAGQTRDDPTDATPARWTLRGARHARTTRSQRPRWPDTTTGGS